MVNVGVPADSDSYHAFSLIGGRRSLAGSSVGGLKETQEMLDFCAANDVAAQIEKIGVDDVDDAYERISASDVRYRCVIDTASLDA